MMAPKFWPLGLGLLLGACAGPMNPFGGIPFNSPDALEEQGFHRVISRPSGEASEEQVSFFFTPERQFYHMNAPLQIRIQSPRPIHPQDELQVLHNGVSVTRFFKRSAVGAREWRLSSEALSLPARQEHKIQVRYRPHDSEEVYGSSYAPPHCELQGDRPLYHTTPFAPAKSIVDRIIHHARQQQLNPNFLAALVAQESGFNPRALSWARALGLTQVTPLASADIAPHHPDWPHYPGLEELSVAHIQTLLWLEEIHSGNEWRLDIDKSLLGALTYWQHLQRYWMSKEAQSLWSEHFHSWERGPTALELGLASYHSGATRVKSALAERGRQWMHHPELSQAQLYLKKIKSYCYHFGRPLLAHDHLGQRRAP